MDIHFQNLQAESYVRFVYLYTILLGLKYNYKTLLISFAAWLCVCNGNYYYYCTVVIGIASLFESYINVSNSVRVSVITPVSTTFRVVTLHNIWTQMCCTCILPAIYDDV